MSEELKCVKCECMDINTHYVSTREGFSFTAHWHYPIHDDWPEADFMFHRCRKCNYVWWSWPSDKEGGGG